MIRVIGFLAAFYVILVGALYLFQRSLIYFPDRSRDKTVKIWDAEP